MPFDATAFVPVSPWFPRYRLSPFLFSPKSSSDNWPHHFFVFSPFRGWGWCLRFNAVSSATCASLTQEFEDFNQHFHTKQPLDVFSFCWTTKKIFLGRPLHQFISYENFMCLYIKLAQFSFPSAHALNLNCAFVIAIFTLEIFLSLQK